MDGIRGRSSGPTRLNTSGAQTPNTRNNKVNGSANSIDLFSVGANQDGNESSRALEGVLDIYNYVSTGNYPGIDPAKSSARQITVP